MAGEACAWVFRSFVVPWAFLHKRHRWLTNSAAIAEMLPAQCLGHHLHNLVKGVDMKRSRAFTPLLVRRVIAALSTTFPIASLLLRTDMDYVRNALGAAHSQQS